MTEVAAATLCAEHKIGTHTGKLPSLAKTIRTLPDPSCPYQIFLGGPTNSRMSIGDADLAAAAAAVTETGAQVFVHSQYIINLCDDTKDWSLPLLQKNLHYAAAAGFKGVVIHVGKATKQPVPAATEKMRVALTKCLEHATSACPILLETPAGQGTETLRGMREFIDFVAGFEDERIRICLDTCHVFACGHDPEAYIRACLEKEPGLLRLVHYNDSMEACGSCKDRHAYVGTGHIGLEKMRRLAEICAGAGVPMVIE